jgi:cation transporter-like permease
LRRVLLAEHAVWVALGVLIGAVAALVAAWPTFRGPEGDLPASALAAALALVLVNALAWTLAATVWAARGDPVEALRDE